jgi:hypothetical protein
MYRYDKDYRSLAKTVAPSTASSPSRRITALPRSCEPSQESSGDSCEPQTVSGLTKTEAEELLDYLEAAGFCQLSHVDGEGFSIRMSCRIKGTEKKNA